MSASTTSSSSIISSEADRVRKLRDRVEAQEAKLRKLRALRGQVDQQRITNGSLCKYLPLGQQSWSWILQVSCCNFIVRCNFHWKSQKFCHAGNYLWNGMWNPLSSKQNCWPRKFGESVIRSKAFLLKVNVINRVGFFLSLKIDPVIVLLALCYFCSAKIVPSVNNGCINLYLFPWIRYVGHRLVSKHWKEFSEFEQGFWPLSLKLVKNSELELLKSSKFTETFEGPVIQMLIFAPMFILVH